MTNDIQLGSELQGTMNLGKIFADSGMFKDIKTQAQAVVKIIAGKELGISPIEAMNSFFFVNEKIAMPSKIMAALVKKSGKYDYAIKKLDETECTMVFSRTVDGKQETIGESTFTFKDAAKAGLVNKEVWKSYPKNMLYARALTNGIRWFCPDVVCGYYSIEEAEDLQPAETKKTIEISADGAVTTLEEVKYGA